MEFSLSHYEYEMYHLLFHICEILDYLELEFVPGAGNTDYVSGTVTYDSFKTFAVKIVMISPTTTSVPLIKDLQAIALA